MSAVTGRSRRPDLNVVEMGVSKYDQVSGLIVALLILVGAAVLMMFVVWLTMVIVFKPAAVPVILVEEVAGRGDNAEGFERDMEAPGMEEMPELAEPQLETQLEAVTTAVTSVAASMDVIDTPSTATSQGQGGLGDNRPPGPEGEGENIIPRWERWEIRFESSSRVGYARQLDFFKIELGAFGGSNTIDYATNLSSGPRKKSGPGKAEKRLYFSWKGGSIQQFDRALLGAAGVNTGAGRSIVQFYPAETENRLAWVEMQYATEQGRPNVKEFLRTVFGVRSAGGGNYEFHIVEMKFRPPPN